MLSNITSSLHFHYKSFNTTTSDSATVLGIGTLTLTVLAVWASPFFQNITTLTWLIQATASRSSLQKPKLESRHLYTGHHLHSTQVTCKFIPGDRNAPGFDVALWFTMRQQWFGFTRLSNPYLTNPVSRFLNAHYHSSLPQQLEVV
jgi:hypothetical protein